MYKIGELSALCRIPVKTLRFYDSEGILAPVYIDNFTGYRYYSASQLSDCYKIVKLKELGFTLAEIRSFISADPEKMQELPADDGVTYLFIQWKSGDYLYGGDIPFWYVFKRVNK